MTYLFLDARYEKVRHEGCVRDLAVLWAVGVNPAGKREVLGMSVSLSEAEPHWRSFLKSLQDRGLSDVSLIISDDHGGLKAARKSIFGGGCLATLPVPSGTECSRNGWFLGSTS
jgi:transposase-like protein